MKALLFSIGFVILAVIIYMYMIKPRITSTPVISPVPSSSPVLVSDPILGATPYDTIDHHLNDTVLSSTPTTAPVTNNTTAPVTNPTTNPVTNPTTSPIDTPMTTQIITPITNVITTALSNYRKVVGSDMNTNDIAGASFIANSEEACAAKCNSIADCEMFAYTSGGVCYPKRVTAVADGNLSIKKGDGTYNVLNLKDYYNFDIHSYTNITQDQCEQYCDNSAPCAMYRYNGGSCWLKSPTAKPGVDMYYRKS